jgi:hypothetical protein
VIRDDDDFDLEEPTGQRADKKEAARAPRPTEAMPMSQSIPMPTDRPSEILPGPKPAPELAGKAAPVANKVMAPEPAPVAKPAEVQPDAKPKPFAKPRRIAVPIVWTLLAALAVIAFLLWWLFA